jgi:hypothetical protein
MNKQKEKEKENLCLTCPLGCLKIPIQNDTMKAYRELVQHFMEYHDRHQLGEALADKILELTKTVKKDKIEALIKKYSNYIGQEHYKITVKILLDLKALLGDSKE